MSGVDVTSNGFLDQEPLNVSEMVTLAGVTRTRQKNMNTSGTDEFDQFRIERLDFTMSGATNVKKDDMRPHSDSVGNGPTIGTARYLLLEANVIVGSDAEIVSFGQDTQFQSADVQFVTDNQRLGSIRAVPVFPKTALQASVKALTMICRSMPSTESVTVSVSVDRCHIQPVVEI